MNPLRRTPLKSQLVIAVLVAALAACGAEETPAPDSPETAATFAALSGSTALALVGPLLADHSAALQSPEPIVEVGRQLTALMDAARERFGALQLQEHCVAVAQVESQRYRVTFTSCLVGQAHPLAVDGQIEVAWQLDVQAKSFSVEAELAGLMINDVALDGQIELSGAIGQTSLGQAHLALVIAGPNGKNSALDVTGSLEVSGLQPRLIVFDGQGQITAGGATFQVTMDGVSYRAGEALPHAGSLTIQQGPLTIAIIFSEQTVSDQLVQLIVNGKDQGQVSLEELFNLILATLQQ